MTDSAIKAIGLGVLTIVLLAGCGGSSDVPTNDGPTQEPLRGPSSILQEFAGVDQFKAEFNEDGGQPRVILLLSPT